MTYDRNHVDCQHCFDHKALKRWIRENATEQGFCPWCGKKGALVRLTDLSETFREVASLYEPTEGPDAYKRGDFISILLDDNWGVFSDLLHDTDNTAQNLAVAILYADVDPKETGEFPDYKGFFLNSRVGSLEAHWDEKAYEALSGATSVFDEQAATSIEREIADEFPDRLSAAFENLSVPVPAGQVYFRARLQDRGRSSRYVPHELSAPPPEKARAGRASRKGEPVLYLATNRSTALAEIRAWKGAVAASAELRLREALLLIDLSQPMKIDSPFFVEFLKWRVELTGLLGRLASDLSRPVMAYENDEAEIIYRPTQLLALLIKANGYDGLIYPSAMGSGRNLVLFDAAKVEIEPVSHTRIKRVAYFDAPMFEYEDVDEEGPYDFALEEPSTSA
jgi:RES domain-containing protein